MSKKTFKKSKFYTKEGFNISSFANKKPISRIKTYNPLQQLELLKKRENTTLKINL